MSKLPVGIQTFPEIISNNFIYVDKTKYLYKLTKGKYHFLSRPRRFGKSLTVSTLKEIFKGNKTLFRGLWIYDKIEWAEHPVIHIDFSKIDFKTRPLNEALSDLIEQIGLNYKSKLKGLSYKEKLRDLIEKLSDHGKVVLLVDEYDKPIIDYLDNIEKAKEHRDLLKNFYSVIKGSDSYLQFVFITGVSKFSQISIFSDLNNLNDISMVDTYTTMLGYTQDELENYFESHIKLLENKFKGIFPVRQEIKEWYNGYSWNGKDFVYNPFSILSLFENLKFTNYWFKTGTPTFLLKLIKNNNYTTYDIENIVVDEDLFNKFEIENLDIIAVLFQTGYLTVKKSDIATNRVSLDYPNKEVAKSFVSHLLSEFTDTDLSKNSGLLIKIEIALLSNNIQRFIELLKIVFANITYPNISNRENYYHSIFYMVMKLLGFNIQSEVITNQGRIDAVVHTDTHIYIIEFKIGEAKTAIKQIKNKKYHQKYQADGKPIILLGIGFDINEKNIREYEIEELI